MKDPDKGAFAAVVRFIPGAILGAAIGFRMVVMVNTPVLFFGGIILMAMLVGFLSARYGLEFWEAVRDSRWRHRR
jgi:uncharacterized membrane protein YccC